MILDKIIETKKEEVAQLKRQTTISALQKIITQLEPCRNFHQALRADACNIIAEVKCASPSRGRLIADFDPVSIAGLYEKNGAAAISVLTDEKYFSGHKNYLTQIRQNVMLPLLRKDFIIDEIQIYETRAIAADAVLLIVRVLGQKLTEFILLSKELGLNPLVEVHTEEELDLALAANANIIGINNRNLDTFVTDIETSRKLSARIPRDKIVVAESGIKERKDITSLMRAGMNAFLIGEGLITAPDIGKKLREVRGELK
ncbi:MAG: indole-3-glycerol phosphate synthase TrpC [Deltaproteobacteria bacterium HGW-Deltaproteobacteria-7]|jgi:indole-3-glycerol phosphate synthase|nr:MAG: indole-3-glycerol phosphate synthase TrpC [Deltaproteobacteria bacterium HGW-Deltaproteobacteria-7]PKN51285.1 MAG: indole-3-glycerol phosphate synthase TrpC [Deltaproteobacteria bacterium HGW-Deltaproteobacteria-13]